MLKQAFKLLFFFFQVTQALVNLVIEIGVVELHGRLFGEDKPVAYFDPLLISNIGSEEVRVLLAQVT